MTFAGIQKFMDVYNGMLRLQPKLVGGKFWYSAKRFYEKNLKDPLNDYASDLLVVRANCALTDKVTGALLVDKNPGGRGFFFDKKGFVQVLKDEKKLRDQWADKTFPVEPIIAAEIPGMNPEQEDVFKGLIV